MSSQELHCSVTVGVGIALTKPGPMVEKSQKEETIGNYDKCRELANALN